MNRYVVVALPLFTALIAGCNRQDQAADTGANRNVALGVQFGSDDDPPAETSHGSGHASEPYLLPAIHATLRHSARAEGPAGHAVETRPEANPYTAAAFRANENGG